MTTLKLVLLSVLQLLVEISLSRSHELQVYPSEYAYHKDSVTRAEPILSANCRNYPSGYADNVRTQDYTHCDGTQLRLTDSDTGPEQYSSSYFYEWSAGSEPRQLLFIFPTRVNLTTITLHYYSDSERGLPRLRFYAVPDDFDVWDAPPGNSRYTDIATVPLGEESAGRRNASINFNFSTKKILMVKTKSDFQFAVSEVEFFTCNVTTVQTEINSTTCSSTNALQTTTMFTRAAGNEGIAGTATNKATTITDHSGDSSSTSTNTMSKANGPGVSLTNDSNIIIGVVIATLILILLVVLALIVLVVMSRKSVKRKTNCDSSYSALNRGTPQQLQPLALHNSSELYDQIHLSPLTGQAEFIRNNETENTNNPQRQQGVRPSIEEQPLQVSLQTAGLNESSENASNTEQPTYAVVNKKQKKKKHTVGKELVPDQKCEAHTEDLRNVKKHKKEISDTKKVSPSKEIESLDQLYTVVKKKPKGSAADEDENAPPVPPHTVEELYTAVNKIPKVRAATKEEEAPPIPPHTVEELYTAVNKTPKGNAADDEEEAPPIPPHTDDM